MFQLFKNLLCLHVILQTLAELATNSTWPCTNEENISQTKLCDGNADCSNARDETVTACLSNICKDGQYRCAYGACIRAELQCNKQIDCFDRSDEAEFLCASDDEVWDKMQGNCTDEEYQCISGECIDEYAMCDGRADCSDESDESVRSCAHITCPDYSFRCGYGACISVQQVCNKIWDCIDGSDELCSVSSEPYKPVEEEAPESSTPTTNTCTIPYESIHLEVRRSGNKQLLNYFDNILRNESVEFKCSAGFELVGVDRLVCVDNNWYHQWPKCTVKNEIKPCLENYTSCDNGECIEQAAFCNGFKDCTDGSDETPPRCLGRTCTENEFQCKYGACIPIKAVCDDNQHCADGSDETRLLCIKDDDEYYKILQGGCDYDEHEELAECSSGECISQSQICDGIPNCSDRSDETVEMCAHIECSNTDFNCAYGACVASSIHCDGRWDCADGSDEMRELCEYVEAERAKYEEESNFDDSYEANIDKIEAIEEDRIIEARKQKEQNTTVDLDKPKENFKKHPPPTIYSGVAFRRCTIPVDRVALRAVLAAENATLKVGSHVNIGAIVTFSCEETWQLAGGESELLCMPLGEWSASVPKCEKRCTPQWSGISTTTTCTYNDAAVDCGTYSKPGTKVVVLCAHGYAPISQSAELHCATDGEWDAPKFKCQPPCVVPPSEPINELLVNIFKLSTDEENLRNPHLKLACKGTIISPKLVLTSALCFSDVDFPGMAANDPVMYSILPARTEYDSFNPYEKIPGRHNISQIIFAGDFSADDLDTPAIVVLVDYFVIVPRETVPICMEFSRSCLNATDKEIPPDLLSEMKGAAFSANGCFVVIGQVELIYMEKYQEWLEMHISSYKYLL